MSNAGGGLPFALRFADIIFVRGVRDPAGQNPKERRVVILTPDAESAAGSPIVAAAVTGTIPPAPLPADNVLLPYKNPPGTRHPKTGTTRITAVVCNWLLVVDPHDVTGRSGFVPPHIMAVVASKTATAAKAMGGWP